MRNIEFKWSVDNMAISPKLNDYEKVVTKVNYTYTATDVDSGESVSYPIEYMLAEPSGKFKSFENLKENEVIEWAKKTYDVSAINNYLIKQLEERIGNKYTPVAAPWLKK